MSLALKNKPKPEKSSQRNSFTTVCCENGDENNMVGRLGMKRIASSCWIHHAKSPLVASCECKTDTSRWAEPLRWPENKEMESINDDFMVIVAIMYHKTKLDDMFPSTMSHSFHCEVKNESSFRLTTLRSFAACVSVETIAASLHSNDTITTLSQYYHNTIIILMMAPRAFE